VLRFRHHPGGCEAGRSGRYRRGLVDRGYAEGSVEDYFASMQCHDNVVCNPPYGPKGFVRKFVGHALSLTRMKVAVILPIAMMNAAHRMREMPLRRMWLLTPRPSMPPGHYITDGKKPGGGRPDYCWLVFDRRSAGHPELGWLFRDAREEANG
jgi:hypothetical protein